MFGVSHVDCAWSEQQGLAPVRQGRDVRGVLGDHGGPVRNALHAYGGEVERVSDLAAGADDGLDDVLDLLRRTDQPNKQLRFGGVGDHVGSAAAGDQSDVERGGTDLFVDRKVGLLQIVEHGNEFVDGRFAQFRVSGVCHLAGCGQHNAQRALGGERELVLCRLTVDQVL